jgi:hypothetical protein
MFTGTPSDNATPISGPLGLVNWLVCVYPERDM